MEQGRIEHGSYVQGDLKFAVDASDAHKTFDAVAALSQPDKVKLAKLNGIQAEPYNKQLLTTILKSVVQNVWFAHKLGTIPTEVLTGHNARLARYNAELSVPSSAVDFLSKKTRAASKTRPTLKYTIDGAKYEAAYAADHNTYRGQRYLVIAAMLGLKPGTAGVSIRDIYEATSETRETARPTRNAVGQVVNKLIEAGIVTLLNPQDVRVKGATKKAATPAPVAPKKAPDTKKKH